MAEVKVKRIYEAEENGQTIRIAAMNLREAIEIAGKAFSKINPHPTGFVTRPTGQNIWIKEEE